MTSLLYTIQNYQGLQMKNKIILLSIFGFVISLLASYSINTIFKKNLIEAEERKLLATAHASASHILSYFKTLENAIITIGSNKTTLNALEQFSKEFYNIEKQIQLQQKEKDSLFSYYKQHLIEKLDNQQNSKLNNYLPRTKSGIIAQHAYILENPFEIGDKEKLLFKENRTFSYNDIHKKYHSLFLREQKNYAFYDIFLIDKKGTIVYSVDKEFDFGTNLNSDIYSSSGLAKVYKKTINLPNQQIVFEDFSPYLASYNKPAAFLSFPIYKKGVIQGVFAVQVPISKINDVTSFDNRRNEFGLGVSGEIYLVGQDKLMRTDSRFIASSKNIKVQKLQTTVGIVKVDTESVEDGLKGRMGAKIIQDYRGINVLSAYLPITIFDKQWVLLAEIDEKELKDLQKNDTLIVFLIAISIISIVILGFIYIIYQYMIKPLEKHNLVLGDSLLELDNKVLVSQSILNEYKKAVDASSIVSKTNLEGRITYANDEFCHISGYEQDELIGNSHSLVKHPDNPDSLFQDIWRTIKSKKIWKGIIKNRKRDGSTYYVNSTIVPILDNNNNIKEFMSIRSDVSELINKEKIILKHTLDISTGLPNRIKLLESIEQNNGEIKLAIIHVEGIQSITDFYSSKHGEKLVIEISKSIQDLLKDKNYQLFRIASTKFALLYLGNIPFNDFIHKCESISQHIDHSSFNIENDHFDVTIIMGIAKNQTNLYANAERALHNAYETDSEIVCYDTSTDLQNNFEQNRKWVTKIKDAINNDRIVVFAQPIVSLNNSKEKKYECLIRMIDTDGSIISPFYFLEIAKNSRLYITLTKIVINKSFQYFSNKNASFSINLTIEDILNEDLLDYLREKITQYDIANKLVLEIVESEGIENFDNITNFINEMKSYGCKISIDDFGTGYSNFEYLMKLDAEYIKIDGSLIKNIDKDESAQLVVELIVDFAKKLNRKTIAEYVHSEEVLKKVKEMKIDFSQGYFTGEPSQIK